MPRTPRKPTPATLIFVPLIPHHTTHIFPPDSRHYKISLTKEEGDLQIYLWVIPKGSPNRWLDQHGRPCRTLAQIGCQSVSIPALIDLLKRPRTSKTMSGINPRAYPQALKVGKTLIPFLRSL